MINNPITSARSIIRGLNQCGIEPPFDLVEALDRATKQLDAFNAVPPSQETITTAVVAVLNAGKDPAADREVQRLITGSTLANVREAIDSRIRSHTLDTILGLTVDIFDLMAVAFEAAVRDLQEAHQILGDVDITDHAAILSQGGTIAEAWVKANTANTRVKNIVSTWRTIAVAVRLTLPQGDALLFLDPTYEQYTDQAKPLPHTAWDAVRRGVALSLSGASDWSTRATAIQDEHDRRYLEKHPPRRSF